MKHILLVEDDLSMLNGLSFAIKKQGYALDILCKDKFPSVLKEVARQGYALEQLKKSKYKEVREVASETEEKLSQKSESKKAAHLDR